MDGWIDRWMVDGWVVGRMVGWIDGCDRWMVEKLIDRWVDALMDDG